VVVGLNARTILLLCSIAALALAGVAHGARGNPQRNSKPPLGTIVPQRGMMEATLGMSRSRVTSILGTPVKVRHAGNILGAYTVYRYKGVSVIFQGNRKATTYTTHSRRLETVDGVGVGSTEAEVKAGLPGTKCRTMFGERSCLYGFQRPGKRLTTFLFKKGLVSRVTVGFVFE